VRDLWDGFCTAFNHAAEVVVCPVYPAGEEPIDGIDHERIVADMRDRGHKGTRAVADLPAAVDLLAGSVRAGDVVISLGAGNVNQVVRDLHARLR
jgi:UDP-N-acetylmuramate--alanine ligase